MAGMQTGSTVRAFLNGVALTHHLVECTSGFYVRINWEGNAYLMTQLEQIASTHALQLHGPPMIISGSLPPYRGVTIFIPGGDTLTTSRKTMLIGQKGTLNWY